MRAALECPYGQRPIRDLAAGCRRPCIIVDDFTRPTPAGRVVPLVLEQLREAGLPAEDVTVVLAKGSHCPIRPGTLEK
jgi:lactate racemase